MQAEVRSVHSGKPKEVPLAAGGTLQTSMLREAQEGPVQVHVAGMEGDGFGLPKVHGTEDQALCVFPVEHWPGLREETGADLGPGTFGENLSLQGLDEHAVRIGSIWRWGEVRMEVTKPRSPCGNLAQVHGVRDLVKRMARTARVGWYCRVLTPGTAAAGEPLVLEQDAPEAPTVAQAWYAQTGIEPD